MQVYDTARGTSTAIHDGLLGWARERMRRAGFTGLECLGAFPAGARTDPQLVLFPYRVGPDPKLTDLNPTPMILGGEGEQGRSSGAPSAWVDVASHLSRGLQELGVGVIRRPVPGAPPAMVRSGLQDLPPSIRAWYQQWGADWLQEGHARMPRLHWVGGIVLTIRYLAVAVGQLPDHDPTRSAPLGIPTLTVLATAIYRERVFEAEMEAPDPPESLPHFVEALSTALEEKGKEELAKELRASLAATRSHYVQQVAIQPISDIGNQELAQMLQSLQQPLQAALTFQLRFSVGGELLFGPGGMPTGRPV